MDLARAQEILNSPKTIGVTFEGDPVWIEELYPERQMALVSSGMFEEGQKTVSVAQLMETNFHDNNMNT